LSSLALKWNYQFLPDWLSTSEFQFDTSIGEASKFEFGLEYANECVIVDFSASRRFATSATLTDKTEFGLTGWIFYRRQKHKEKPSMRRIINEV